MIQPASLWLGPTQAPFIPGQERRPEERTNMDQHLRGADDDHQSRCRSCRHAALTPESSDRLDGRCDDATAPQPQPSALRLGLGVRKAAGFDVVGRLHGPAPRRCVAAGAVELARADAGFRQDQPHASAAARSPAIAAATERTCS